MRIRYLRAPDDAGAQQQTGQQQTGQQQTGQQQAGQQQADAGKPAAASIFDAAGGDPNDAAQAAKAGAGPEGVNFADWVPANFRRDKPVELTADQMKMLQHVDIEGLARSQADLRAKIGTGAFKPPAKAEEYAFDMPQGVDMKIDAGDPVMSAFKTSALAAGLSKEQFAKLAAPMIATFAKLASDNAGGQNGGAPLTPEQREAQAQAAQAEQAKAFQAEIEKLGPNGAEAVRQTGKWLKGLETKGVFTAEEFGALRAISDAAGVTALRKLMNMTGEKPVPIDLGEAATGLSIEDAKALLTQAHVKLQADANDAKGQADRARALKALERYEKAGQLQAPVYS